MLAFHHTDLIKVWLLPVQRPWFEDPFIPLVTAMRGELWLKSEYSVMSRRFDSHDLHHQTYGRIA